MKKKVCPGGREANPGVQKAFSVFKEPEEIASV